MAKTKKNLQNTVKDKFNSTLERTKEGIEDTKERTEKYLSNYPLESVAIAAGVGIIIGVGISAFLLKSRKTSIIDNLLQKLDIY